MKVTRLVDAKLEVTFLSVRRRYFGKRTEAQVQDAYVNDLKVAAKELDEFLRDHRSRDMVSLDVVLVHEDACSFCGTKWENALDENGKPMCCNAAIDEAGKTAVKGGAK